MDDLPAAVRFYDKEDMTKQRLERNFPLGYTTEEGVQYIYNHISFYVRYHTDESEYKVWHVVAPLNRRALSTCATSYPRARASLVSRLSRSR